MIELTNSFDIVGAFNTVQTWITSGEGLTAAAIFVVLGLGALLKWGGKATKARA